MTHASDTARSQEPDDLERLAAFRADYLTMPARQAELIAACRANGRTWPQIARALDMTEHGAIKAANPSPTRSGRPRTPRPDASPAATHDA